MACSCLRASCRHGRGWSSCWTQGRSVSTTCTWSTPARILEWTTQRRRWVGLSLLLLASLFLISFLHCPFPSLPTSLLLLLLLLPSSLPSFLCSFPPPPLLSPSLPLPPSVPWRWCDNGPRVDQWPISLHLQSSK